MDPGLLLSTVSTATAALVAIVGGLLVSRVVSLATERSGLLHRRNDLAANLEHEKDRLVQSRRRLLEFDAEEVLLPHYDELADPDQDREYPLQAWISDAGVGRTVAEILPFAQDVRKAMRLAREQLEPMFREVGPIELSFDDMVQEGLIGFPPGARDIYEAAYERLQEDYPEPKQTFRGIEIPAVGSVNLPKILFSAQDAADHRRAARDVDEVDHRVQALELQVEQAELALSRVSKPKGVLPGLGVLTYFAGVGTVLPLVLMLDPDDMFDWTPKLVIGLFASGLVALLVYVLVEVQQLSRR